MRVLMLAQFYPPAVGGEERAVQDLSRGLARRGHDVHVATIWHPGMNEMDADEGVTVHRVLSSTGRMAGAYADARRHAPPFPDPELMLNLRKLVKEIQPDVVHAHNWIVHSYVPLRLAGGPPLVMSMHSYSYICPVNQLVLHDELCSGPQRACFSCSIPHYGKKGPALVVAHAATRPLLRKAVDMFTPVSEAVVVNSHLRGTGVRYTVIPNILPQSPEVDIAEHMAELPEGEFLLFVGDLRRFKGIHTLFDAYRKLESPPPLVVIGRLCPDTPKEWPENVIHLGPWPHAAIMEAWSRCRAAVLPPSGAEPFGLVVLEAASRGAAVVATRTGAIPEILREDESCLLVEPNDSTGLAAQIERVLRDPDLSRQLGEAARARSADYRAEHLLPKHEAVYELLVAERAKNRSALQRESVA